MLLVKLALCALAAYLAVVAAAYAFQRRLMYAPDPAHTLPAQAGLSGVAEEEVRATDGERLVAWYGAAKPGQPTILYFHGNGGALESRAERFRRYMAQGRGMFMLAWRGYSGSSGAPSEAHNVADALSAYAVLRAKGVAPADIIVYGESLGTGVAAQIAAAVPVGGLILDAPYTSMVDLAATIYPWLPVRLLTIDRYDTMRVIARVTAPLLVIQGERDAIVPVAMGRAVFAAATAPKSIETFPLAGHADHYLYGSYDTVQAWIDRGTWKKLGPRQ